MRDDAHRCLLVVDDEADFRALFRRHFRRRGYEVLEAADGVAALELFERHAATIDLVATDILMPRMRGEELIKKLRHRRRYLPILGVTGQADLRGKLAFLDGGAYYYLEKPVEHWAIVERLVENAIHLHHYEEQVHVKREKEREIARLLRAYILEGPLHDHGAGLGTDARRFELEIAMEPIEIAWPGGDYVEWFDRGGDEVVFYVADASGHNDLVSSFTSCLASMVLHRCHHGLRPSVDRIIRFIDQALDQLRAAGALDVSRHLTFFIGCVDLASGELTYVNAGHPEAFLLRDGSSEAAAVERLPSTCPPVGYLSMARQEIGVGRLALHPGDLLFVYTDGACEPLEKSGDPQSGSERLLAAVRPRLGRPAAEVVAGVREFLVEQVGPEGFEDDTTLMAIRVREA